MKGKKHICVILLIFMLLASTLSYCADEYETLKNYVGEELSHFYALYEQKDVMVYSAWIGVANDMQ